jgi:integrase
LDQEDKKQKQRVQKIYYSKKTFEPKELRELLKICNPLYTAIILISATGGLRKSEVLALKKEWIKLDTNPPEINIPAHITKTEQERTTYITQETKEAIENWIKVRDNYMESSISRMKANNPNNKLVATGFSHPENLFPINASCVGSYYRRKLKRTLHFILKMIEPIEYYITSIH